MMYGQMTAGSWIYIGSQGIVWEPMKPMLCLAARHFAVEGGKAASLRHTLNVTAGLGGMGGSAAGHHHE